MNPFKYGCVVDGEFFCPRPELERQLRAFAESGQNVVVQGERRMGKTSLIKHTEARGLTPLVEWEWWSSGADNVKGGQREWFVGRIGNSDRSVEEYWAALH